MTRLTLAVALLALGACKKDEDTGAAVAAGGPTCDDPGATVTYVMRQISFARSEGGVAWGFNLDDSVSEIGDPNGCGKQDLTDPEGQPGIDNAFAGLLPTLEQTEAAAVSGLLQASVTSGELLIAMELQGVDDLQNDDCVAINFGAATGTPLLGTDGLILPGQTFSRELDEDSARVEGARIEDGRLIFGADEFGIQIQILDAKLDLGLYKGQVHVDIDPDGGGATGFFGGAFSIDYMTNELGMYAIDAALKDLLNQALPIAADMKGESGTCDHLSVALEYEAVPAFFFDDDTGEAR